MRAGLATWVVAYVVTLLVLCGLDGVWLTTMLPTYQRGLASLMAPAPALVPAVLFYLLYAAGIVGLVVLPGVTAGRWHGVAARGALFGLVAYGTYDLTNQATLRDWPVTLTVLDMAWGTVLTAVAATVAYMLAARASRYARSRAARRG
jgi:uncharacterized membrane protein